MVSWVFLALLQHNNARDTHHSNSPNNFFSDSVESCVPLERCNAPRSILWTLLLWRNSSLPKRRLSLLLLEFLQNITHEKQVEVDRCVPVLKREKEKLRLLEECSFVPHTTLRNCDVPFELERMLWLSQCVSCMHFGNSLTYGSVDDSGILILRIHRLWTVYEVATAGSLGRDTSTGHRVKSYDEPMLPTYVVECVYESILVKVDMLEHTIQMCTKPCP